MTAVGVTMVAGVGGGVWIPPRRSSAPPMCASPAALTTASEFCDQKRFADLGHANSSRPWRSTVYLAFSAWKRIHQVLRAKIKN